MGTLDQEMVPRRATRVVAQQAAGKWVLLDVKSGQYYALDPVAGRIWQLCDGTRSVQQIAEVLSEEFDTGGQAVVARLSGEASDPDEGEADGEEGDRHRGPRAAHCSSGGYGGALAQPAAAGAGEQIVEQAGWRLGR